MSLTTNENRITTEELRELLAGRRLPKWAPWALAGGAIGISLLLLAVGVLGGLHRQRCPRVCCSSLVRPCGAFGSKVVGTRPTLRDHVDLLGICRRDSPAGRDPLLGHSKGLEVLRPEFFTETMRNVSSRGTGGGILHALIGTIEQVLMATIIAVPIGVMVAIYLVEYGKGKLATTISFFVDVMTGVPSIVAGLFIFTGPILTFGLERSGFAASLALVILMLPVVVRTTEEMLKLFPGPPRGVLCARRPEVAHHHQHRPANCFVRHHHRRHAGRCSGGW